jgi:hypothetical protein
MKRRIVPGTLRYKIDGKFVYRSPGERSYSTALMLADSYYAGRKWVPYVPGLDNLSDIGKKKSHGHQVRHRKTGGNKSR